MAHIYEARFLKDLPYTEEQFSEAWHLALSKKPTVTINGTTVTVGNFGALVGGYSVIGIGTQDFTITQTGYIYVHFIRDVGAGTQSFQLLFSTTVPNTTTLNKYGAVVRVVYNAGVVTAFTGEIPQIFTMKEQLAKAISNTGDTMEGNFVVEGTSTLIGNVVAQNNLSVQGTLTTDDLVSSDGVKYSRIITDLSTIGATINTPISTLFSLMKVGDILTVARNGGALADLPAYFAGLSYNYLKLIKFSSTNGFARVETASSPSRKGIFETSIFGGVLEQWRDVNSYAVLSASTYSNGASVSADTYGALSKWEELKVVYDGQIVNLTINDALYFSAF